MRTVCLIEGFSGGPILTKTFRKALTEAGFKIVKNRQEADIIIAHSAACYSLPKIIKAKLVMFIDPPYWPGKSLSARFKENYRTTTRHDLISYGRRYSFRKRLLQSVYTITRTKYFWLGLSRNKTLEFLSVNSPVVLLIRNNDDSFCGSQIERKAQQHKNIIFIELPGIHDDYVTNPSPYIALLLKYN